MAPTARAQTVVAVRLQQALHAKGLVGYGSVCRHETSACMSMRMACGLAVRIGAVLTSAALPACCAMTSFLFASRRTGPAALLGRCSCLREASFQVR